MSKGEQVLEDSSMSMSEDELKALQDALEQLIDAIHPPRSMVEQTRVLRENIAGDLNPRHLIGLLQRLSAIAVATRCEVDDVTEERQVLFNNISEKIDELDKTLMTTDQQIQTSSQGAQNAVIAMERQLQDIVFKFRRTNDPASIRTWMDQRLSIVLTKQEELQEQVSHLQTGLQGQMQTLFSLAKEIRNDTLSVQQENSTSELTSLVDPVTGVTPRIGYESVLRDALSQDLDKNPFIVQFWDLDHLKKLNESYDRQAGDRSLAMVAKILGTHLRDEDFISRYGGDCFALILPRTDLETGAQIAYRIRTAVEGADFHYHGNPVSMTVSGSYTQRRADDTPETIRQRLEDALGRAKKAGRNCCLSADK